MATYLNKILFILLFPVLLVANDKTLESIYEQILITYSTIYAYEAEFMQENYWNEINVCKTSEGKLYYNKENLLMDYIQPKGQKLQIKENSITMYDPVTEQAFISDQVDIELRPDKLISHYWDVSEKELIGKYEDTEIIQLMTPESEIILITITNSLVMEFNIVDINENFVNYKFSNILINKGLAESIFELNFPENTSVIDTRSK